MNVSPKIGVSYVILITGGTGSGQYRYITGNDSISLTVSEPWTTNPAAGSSFEIYAFANKEPRATAGVTNPPYTSLSKGAGPDWTADAYTGYYVLIVSGTGAGQIREINYTGTDYLGVDQTWSTNS